MRPRSGQALGRRDPVGTPGPHSLSVHSPWPLQLEGPQSSSLQAAPRQKCPVHTQRPSTQVPWPLQSGGWQRGSRTHTTVDTCRGQRHMLSWLQEGAGGEERPRAGQQVPQVPSPRGHPLTHSSVTSWLFTGFSSTPANLPSPGPWCTRCPLPHPSHLPSSTSAPVTTGREVFPNPQARLRAWAAAHPRAGSCVFRSLSSTRHWLNETVRGGPYQ